MRNSLKNPNFSNTIKIKRPIYRPVAFLRRMVRKSFKPEQSTARHFQMDKRLLKM